MSENPYRSPEGTVHESPRPGFRVRWAFGTGLIATGAIMIVAANAIFFAEGLTNAFRADSFFYAWLGIGFAFNLIGALVLRGVRRSHAKATE